MRKFPIALVLLAGAACAPAPESYRSATLALLDVRVVDVETGTVSDGRMVVIDGDRIVDVAAGAPARLPAGTRRIAGGGAYVLPGLTDMHVHSLSAADDALERAFPLFVANGVTSVRDMGSTLPVLVEVRERLAAEPARPAPRLIAAGPLLDGTRKPWYGDLPLILESPQAVREELPRLAEAGVDFLKVYDDLAPAAYEEIAAYASASELAFAGHVPAGVPVPRAVELGQRTIEHFGLSTVKDCVDDPAGWFGRAIDAKFRTGYDAYYALLRDHWDAVDWSRCEPVLAALARPGVYFTPTLDMEWNDRARVDEESLRYLAPGSRDWCSQLLDNIDGAEAGLRETAYGRQRDAFQRIREAGARVLAGSDTPNNCVVAGFSLHTELALLVESGMTPREALLAATVHAAEALGRGAVAGRVAAGAEADLLLLDRNPLDEIGHSRSIRGVLLRGEWLDREALDALLAGAAGSGAE